MNKLSLVEKAYLFAKLKHEGQFRRDGITPYFTHCEKVASLVDTDFEKVVAYCHDLIEDRKATYYDISENISNSVADVCEILTHTPDVNYDTYIERLKNNKDWYNHIINIKIADIVANLSDSPTQKQIEKYNKALRILVGVN